MDKKPKPVILLSSLHRTALQGEHKPEMIEFYNATKSGVDNMDHMVRFYSSKRKTRRWSYSFFMNLVDIMALNAFVAYKTGHPQESRYLFLKKLSHQLLMPLMEARRSANSRLPKTLVSKINLFLPATSSSEFQSNLSNATRKRKRCNKCPASADKKTDVVCQHCSAYLCLSHRRIVCENCL